MPELPVSVRLALWVTHAWTHGRDADAVINAAHPDLARTTGNLAQLDIWHSLGERALFVALPAPGDLVGLPTAPPDATSAAVTAGECVFVASLGGLLVPDVDAWVTTWHHHKAEPVPAHVIDGIDPGAIRRRLMGAVADATEELEIVGGQPWNGAAVRDEMTSTGWALPHDLPPRILDTVRLSAAVWSAAHAGLAEPSGAVDTATTAHRETVLRRLARVADRCLADSANAAASTLARESLTRKET